MTSRGRPNDGAVGETDDVDDTDDDTDDDTVDTDDDGGGAVVASPVRPNESLSASPRSPCL